MGTIEEELKSRKLREESVVNSSGLRLIQLRRSPENTCILVALWIRATNQLPEKGYTLELRETNESISLLISLSNPPQSSMGGSRATLETGYFSFQKFLEKYFPN